MLKQVANEHLRLLCLAYRELTPADLNCWERNMMFLKQTEGQDKEGLVEMNMGEIEKNLIPIAITGVKDKIQEGIPETVDFMLKADVRVNILTGDELTTALNVARACGIVQHKMQVVPFLKADENTIVQQIQETIQMVAL